MLPKPVLVRRLQNELEIAKRMHPNYRIAVISRKFDFPLTIRVDISGIPALEMRDGRVVVRQNHTFIMEVSEEYPYKKPTVIWATPIFHPNIMLPQDGGFVCIKQLDTWNFHSNLSAFISGIEMLLTNPNPRSPYGTESCTMAAEYFNKKSGTRRLPRIVR